MNFYMFLLLLLSLNVLAIEPCEPTPKDMHRKDGVFSFEDAVFRAEQVFGYVLSLKSYCNDEIKKSINLWFNSNKQLIDRALIIRSKKLESDVENTTSALWQSTSAASIDVACKQIFEELINDKHSYFGGRVYEYLTSYVPTKHP